MLLQSLHPLFIACLFPSSSFARPSPATNASQSLSIDANGIVDWIVDEYFLHLHIETSDPVLDTLYLPQFVQRQIDWAETFIQSLGPNIPCASIRQDPYHMTTTLPHGNYMSVYARSYPGRRYSLTWKRLKGILTGILQVWLTEAQTGRLLTMPEIKVYDIVTGEGVAYANILNGQYGPPGNITAGDALHPLGGDVTTAR